MQIPPLLCLTAVFKRLTVKQKNERSTEKTMRDIKCDWVGPSVCLQVVYVLFIIIPLSQRTRMLRRPDESVTLKSEIRISLHENLLFKQEDHDKVAGTRQTSINQASSAAGAGLFGIGVVDLLRAPAVTKPCTSARLETQMKVFFDSSSTSEVPVDPNTPSRTNTQQTQQIRALFVADG